MKHEIQSYINRLVESHGLTAEWSNTNNFSIIYGLKDKGEFITLYPVEEMTLKRFTFLLEDTIRLSLKLRKQLMLN